MPRVYATPDQLAAYTGAPAPADAVRLLTRASEDIDDALSCALYDTDAQGMPTDTEVIEALADATCAVVEYRTATQDDGTGAAGQWGSVSLGPATLSDRRTPAGSDGITIAPRADRTLRRAGLLPGVIW